MQKLNVISNGNGSEDNQKKAQGNSPLCMQLGGIRYIVLYLIKNVS